MQITIPISNSLESLEKRFDIYWKLTTKKSILQLLLKPVVGLVFILVALLSEPYSVVNSFTPDGMKKATYFNLNIFLAIGIVWICLSLLDFLRTMAYKTQMRDNYLKLANKEMTIHLSDENITTQMKGMTEKTDWKLFSGYKELQNFILLETADPFVRHAFIEKAAFAEADLREFTRFLHQQFPHKRGN